MYPVTLFGSISHLSNLSAMHARIVRMAFTRQVMCHSDLIAPGVCRLSKRSQWHDLTREWLWQREAHQRLIAFPSRWHRLHIPTTAE